MQPEESQQKKVLTVVVFYPRGRTAVNQEWETHKITANKKKYFFFQVSGELQVLLLSKEAMQELERKRTVMNRRSFVS